MVKGAFKRKRDEGTNFDTEYIQRDDSDRYLFIYTRAVIINCIKIVI